MKCSALLFILIVVASVFAPSASHSETFGIQVHQTDGERTAELKSKLASDPSDLSARLELAELLEKQKVWHDVIALLQPKTESLPTRGLLLLARAFGQSGNSLDEVKTLELARAKDPRTTKAHVALGEALGRAGRSEDAIMSYREAIKLQPKALEAYKGILRELEKTHENPDGITLDAYEARTLLNDMIKLFGRRSEFLSQLCKVYTKDAYLEKAVETCNEAIAKAPSTIDNYVYLAVALRDQQEADKAASALAKGIKRFPDSERLHVAAGELQMARKNFASAYRYFRKAVVFNRKSAKAVLGYAQSSFELQKNQESLDAFIEACRLDRALTKELRLAIGKLRVRKDTAWQLKYEKAIDHCL